MRRFLFARCLVPGGWFAAALLATLLAADPPLLTFTVEPPDRPPAATLAPAVAEARKILGQFAAAGLHLAPIPEPRSPSEFAATLAALLADTRAQLAQLEREQSAADQAATAATAEVSAIAAQADALAQRQAGAAREFATLRPKVIETQQQAIRTREQFLAAQKHGVEIRERIRQARNRLFPKLNAALERGWVLPPSRYRELPAAPSLKLAAVDTRGSVALGPPEPRLRGRTGAMAPTTLVAAPPPPPAAAAFAGADDVAQRIRTQLHDLAALVDRAAALSTRRAAAAGRSAQTRAAAAAQSTRLGRLEGEAAATAAQRAELQRLLDHARDVAAQEARQLAEAHRRNLGSLVEAATYRWLDRRAEQVFTTLLHAPPRPEDIATLRDVAEVASRLGADAPRALGALASRPDAVPEIRRETAALRTELAIAPAAAEAADAAALRPFLEESR